MRLKSSRPVRLWLWCVAALVFLTVIVGGATRLTESGLSIVEWRPVTGAIPPLSRADWEAEFEKYKVIPQYQLMNRGMSLDEFKTIYWWEWAHRMLGRLIGVAFLLPFLWFLWRGAIGPGMRAGLATIFALGAAQGAIGWWMVSSGFAEGVVSVSHNRLAFHLTLACVIYAAIVWMAMRLSPMAGAASGAPLRLRLGAFAIMALTLVQFYLGALVAGLRAGLIHNTWPLIDGRFIPSSADLFFNKPIWVNFIENVLTVQFNHRMAGYVLMLGALAHLIDVWLTRDRGAHTLGWAFALALAMGLQLVIGVYTLIYHVPIDLALLHQAGAMIVLTIAVIHAERLTPQRTVEVADRQPALSRPS